MTTSLDTVTFPHAELGNELLDRCCIILASTVYRHFTKAAMFMLGRGKGLNAKNWALVSDKKER